MTTTTLPPGFFLRPGKCPDCGRPLIAADTLEGLPIYACGRCRPDAVDLYRDVADGMLAGRTRPGMPPSERLAAAIDVAAEAWDTAAQDEQRRRWEQIAEELGV